MELPPDVCIHHAYHILSRLKALAPTSSMMDAVCPDPSYTAFAEINLALLRQNLRIIQNRVQPARIMAVLKANAYGHGAIQVARTLAEEGIRHFFVATLAEACQLREVDIPGVILPSAPPLPAHLPFYSERSIDVAVTSTEVARIVIEAARSGLRLNVHAKIDTGMGRLGMPPDEAPATIRALHTEPGVTLRGIWTHLATAGSPDRSFAHRQLDMIRGIVRELDDYVGDLHVGNTSAMLNLAPCVGKSERELLRLGGALLGMSALPEEAHAAGLRPILTLKSRILHLKTISAGTTLSYERTWRADQPTRIATVGAGYADGYPAGLSSETYVAIGNRLFPIAGKVCMDLMMVNLGPPGNTRGAIHLGDSVTLFGGNGVSIHDLARLSGKKAYEICCSISPRVPRIYDDGLH